MVLAIDISDLLTVCNPFEQHEDGHQQDHETVGQHGTESLERPGHVGKDGSGIEQPHQVLFRKPDLFGLQPAKHPLQALPQMGLVHGKVPDEIVDRMPDNDSEKRKAQHQHTDDQQHGRHHGNLPGEQELQQRHEDNRNEQRKQKRDDDGSRRFDAGKDDHDRRQDEYRLSDAVRLCHVHSPA